MMMMMKQPAIFLRCLGLILAIYKVPFTLVSKSKLTFCRLPSFCRQHEPYYVKERNFTRQATRPLCRAAAV